MRPRLSGALVNLWWWFAWLDVKFQQSVSGALIMRQVFEIYFSRHGHPAFPWRGAESGGATIQVLPDIFFHKVLGGG
jgi:hypothetical protein